MSILNVSLIQSDIIWENPTANHSHLNQLLNNIPSKTELVVLTEMFNTGFSMNASDLAEEMNGPTIKWMKLQARKHQAVIAGSLMIHENGNFYNRFIWTTPSGAIEHSDKRHLFTLAKEEKVFTAGTEKKMINYKDWKILPLICYDIRFPVWSRYQDDYDLLIYVANFPSKRAHAWSSLLTARAIENMSYTIGVNRVGIDGNGIPYSGNSAAIDYEGKKLAEAAHQENIINMSIDKKQQDAFRERFAFLEDRDNWSIKNG